MYKLRVLINDKPVKQYHDKSGNIWVEAVPGSKYAIEVKNDAWQKMLAVVSVDGLNVINGKREEPCKSTGYVVQSYNNVIIKGWRTSSEQVKEFYFTSPEDSYSSKLGADLSNIGVIGAVIYTEVPGPTTTYSYTYPAYPYPDTYNTSQNSIINFSCSVNDFSTERMATGSGVKVEDKSNKVHFGEKMEVARMIIYYDNWNNLVKKGVIRNGYKDELPRPFPSNGNYCPDL